MDVALLAASASLTVYLPSCVYHEGTSRRHVSSISISLLLSFLLFSLSVLEATPQKWMLLLTNEETAGIFSRNGFLTVKAAYQMVLGVLTLLVIIVFPCLVGGKLLLALRTKTPADPDDEKKRTFMAKRKRTLALQTSFKILSLLVRLIRYIVVAPLVSLLRRMFSACSKGRADKGPILIMTQRDGQKSEPSTQIQTFLSNTHFRRSMILGSISGILCSLLFLNSVGPLVIRTSEETNFLAKAVSWLCAIGILLSALLNGFGSVSLPHGLITGRVLKPVSSEAIAQAEVDLHRAKSSLEERRRDMGSSEFRIHSNSTGTWRKMSFTDLGGEVVQRRKDQSNEIAFLETLVDEMQEDVAEMRYAQTLAAAARTPLGRIRSWLGLVFSIVLLARLFSAIHFLWAHQNTIVPGHSSSPRGDPVTTVLLWLMGHNFVKTQHDYNTLSQFISLTLTAILSFSQVRTLLRTLSAVNSRLNTLYRRCYCRTPRTPKNKANTTAEAFSAELLASVMGSYFLACIVLTKLMLPFTYRTSFSAALGGDDIFQIRSFTVNSAFALSAMVSTAVLGMLLGIQRQNTHRHTTTWAEDNNLMMNTIDP